MQTSGKWHFPPPKNILVEGMCVYNGWSLVAVRGYLLMKFCYIVNVILLYNMINSWSGKYVLDMFGIIIILHDKNAGV